MLTLFREAEDNWIERRALTTPMAIRHQLSGAASLAEHRYVLTPSKKVQLSDGRFRISEPVTAAPQNSTEYYSSEVSTAKNCSNHYRRHLRKQFSQHKINCSKLPHIFMTYLSKVSKISYLNSGSQFSRLKKIFRVFTSH